MRSSSQQLVLSDVANSFKQSIMAGGGGGGSFNGRVFQVVLEMREARIGVCARRDYPCGELQKERSRGKLDWRAGKDPVANTIRR